MKKQFVGLLYGREVWVKAKTKDEALDRFKTFIGKPKRTFIQRLKYLITNK